MIPADVDLNALRSQLAADSVAIDEMGRQYPHLEGQLIEASNYAADSGFGTTGIVVLDRTPDLPTDVRDIAQELLNTTQYDNIIVRTPGTGAVVSHNHSRATLESAQWYFLNDPDFARGVHKLVDLTNQQQFPWAAVNVLIAALVILTVAAVLISVTTRPKALL